MPALLVILAVVVAMWAALSFTKATLGVGLMALACLLAILARLAQAAAQHKELKQLLNQQSR